MLKNYISNFLKKHLTNRLINCNQHTQKKVLYFIKCQAYRTEQNVLITERQAVLSMPMQLLRAIASLQNIRFE